MQIDDMISVLRAYKDGREIEQRYVVGIAGTPPECEVKTDCDWNITRYDYRVKADPLELWVNIYPSGITTCHNTGEDARARATSCARTVLFREVIV